MIEKIKIADFHTVIDKTINQSNPLHLKVTGRSMHPFWLDGISTVTIEPLKDDLKKHDIVLLNVNNHFILHRVIKIEGEVVQTRGDYVATPDPQVKTKHIVGKVTAYKRRKKQRPISNLFHKSYLYTLYPLYTFKQRIKRKVRRLRRDKKR